MPNTNKRKNLNNNVFQKVNDPALYITEKTNVKNSSIYNKVEKFNSLYETRFYFDKTNKKIGDVYESSSKVWNALRQSLKNDGVVTKVDENNNSISKLFEGQIEKSEIIIAAREVTDKLQNMIEDLSEIKTENILPLLDGIKTHFGNEYSEKFDEVTQKYIDEAYNAVRETKDQIGTQINNLEKLAAGEEPEFDLDADSDDSDEEDLNNIDFDDEDDEDDSDDDENNKSDNETSDDDIDNINTDDITDKDSNEENNKSKKKREKDKEKDKENDTEVTRKPKENKKHSSNKTRITEKAPPGTEDWIKKRKKDFKERYGNEWKQALYSTAWKLYNEGKIGSKKSESIKDKTKTKVFEKSPPDKEIQKWIEDKEVKKSFKEQYGDDWEKVLYATAWDKYNEKHNKNESIKQKKKNNVINESTYNYYLKPDFVDNIKEFFIVPRTTNNETVSKLNEIFSDNDIVTTVLQQNKSVKDVRPLVADLIKKNLSDIDINEIANNTELFTDILDAIDDFVIVPNNLRSKAQKELNEDHNVSNINSWSSPNSPSDYVGLYSILRTKLTPRKAKDELYWVLGNNELYNILEVSERNNPQKLVNSDIILWIKENRPHLYNILRNYHDYDNILDIELVTSSYYENYLVDDDYSNDDYDTDVSDDVDIDDHNVNETKHKSKKRNYGNDEDVGENHNAEYDYKVKIKNNDDVKKVEDIVRKNTNKLKNVNYKFQNNVLSFETFDERDKFLDIISDKDIDYEIEENLYGGEEHEFKSINEKNIEYAINAVNESLNSGLDYGTALNEASELFNLKKNKLEGYVKKKY